MTTIKQLEADMDEALGDVVSFINALETAKSKVMVLKTELYNNIKAIKSIARNDKKGVKKDYKLKKTLIADQRKTQLNKCDEILKKYEKI